LVWVGAEAAVDECGGCVCDDFGCKIVAASSYAYARVSSPLRGNSLNGDVAAGSLHGWVDEFGVILLQNLSVDDG
jgi:hypothetical protein